MRMRGVPIELTKWIREKLSGCKARLAFDDHISDPLCLHTGIDQGCPLSPISYVFYNADLVRSDNSRDTLRLSFHDDTVFLARAKTFDDANNILLNMMTTERGALQWAKSHHSLFEIDKTALICFTRRRDRQSNKRGQLQGTPLTLEGRIIHPQRTTKCLGVVIDNELQFREHAAQAIAKGAKWSIALKRMCQGIKGIPAHLACRLYINAAVPSFLYAADVFLPNCSARTAKDGSPQYLKCGPTAKLASTQRQAALAITGAIRTTATNAAEVHANLLPFHLLISKLCLQAVLRYTTLPDNHPPAKTIRRASTMQVKRH